MTFLLVIVWVLTALMGSLAVARFYKSKAVSEASGSGHNAPIVFWVTFIAIFVFLAVFAYTLSSSTGHTKGSPSVSAGVYPIAADAQDIWPKVGETVKVKIRPDCWSGWINLPANDTFLVDTPGEVEVWFWSGERFLIRDKEPRRWLGTIPHCTFRLRGTTGEATIIVGSGTSSEPIPAPIIIRKESPIAPDEVKGEVNYPTSPPPPLIRKKEAPIKPEP